MAYNYGKIQGRIKEMGLTQREFASKINMSETLLCNKLRNRAPMTQEDMETIGDSLHIPKSEYGVYFFTPKVEFSEL